VLLGYLDFKAKRGGVGGVLYPSGDLAADMVKLRVFYTTIAGKHPDQASDVVLEADVLPAGSATT
jgi:hypothetical protein